MLRRSHMMPLIFMVDMEPHGVCRGMHEVSSGVRHWKSQSSRDPMLPIRRNFPEFFFQGLAALAAFNIARGDEQSVEEALDLLNEACATTKVIEEGENTAIAGDESLEEGDSRATATSANAIGLARASVLCTAAQGELVLGRGTATASERLGEALRIREKLLPVGHPATVGDGSF